MRKTCQFLLTSLLACISIQVAAESGQTYLNKFLTYTHWCQNLPTTIDPEFIAFIENPSPLTRKLREKWLYQLAKRKDWATYSAYYRDSTDTNLQCYEQTALYQQGQHEQAVQNSKPLWLNGGSQPKACDDLFNLLLTHHEISEQLIEQRINLALEARNISLARYLLKQFTPPRLHDIDLLSAIHQTPTRITQLQPGALHGAFYLYGLKLLIPRNIDLAIKLGQGSNAKIMNEAQQQVFLAHIALYKAMRNEEDAVYWLNKVKTNYYTEQLLDWEIRYAIAHHHWDKLISLINHLQNKDLPNWQYWLARAYEATGNKSQAIELYQQLGNKRNYYGFLANIRLRKRLSFENEPVNKNPDALTIYKPITDQIKSLSASRQNWLAARLLNDFISELPKEEKSALAYWVANELHWNGRSIYLSNNEVLNNQLALRFPLVYQEIIHKFSSFYQISRPLIYAIIRQESTFFEDIVSSAGANGLMQIMPRTAKIVTKEARINYSNSSELFNSEKNINIGTAYLRQLAREFHSHPVLMAAAYNAGPRQVRYWLRNHQPKEIDVWIETLPWQETRNYLKNIIAFYAVYQYRLREDPNLNEFLKPF
ncbi:MAG: transglycosylase SLT domain-containing protein [Legionellaceae bacterium]|nr:transglycosylase SLT domain-containing protein [Legionellaceae bacterium]